MTHDSAKLTIIKNCKENCLVLLERNVKISNFGGGLKPFCIPRGSRFSWKDISSHFSRNNFVFAVRTILWSARHLLVASDEVPIFFIPEPEDLNLHWQQFEKWTSKFHTGTIFYDKPFWDVLKSIHFESRLRNQLDSDQICHAYFLMVSWNWQLLLPYQLSIILPHYSFPNLTQLNLRYNSIICLGKSIQSFKRISW